VIDLGIEFKQALMRAVGEDPDSIALDTVRIAFVNPNGPSTVRYQRQVDVQEDVLARLVAQYAPAVPVVVDPVVDPPVSADGSATVDLSWPNVAADVDRQNTSD
jgi:hypothetical protein